MADEGPSEYEQARERMRQNAVKLEELQVRSASATAKADAEAQRAQHAAERQAAREKLAGDAGPRRRTGRAAAARTRTKLQQQAGGADGSDDADSAVSASNSSSDEEDHSGSRKGKASEVYDPLDDAGCSEEEHSESVEHSDADDDAVPARRSASAACAKPAGRPSATASAVRAADAGGAGSAPTDQSEAEAQLQQALALSLGQAAGRAAAAAAPPPADLHPKPKAKRKELAKGSAKGQQGKRKRADAGPPSEEDIAAAFTLFNRQGLSAVIASDIEKVAREALGVDLEPAHLHNMMERASDVLNLQQPRLTLDEFQRLTHHYCG